MPASPRFSYSLQIITSVPFQGGLGGLAFGFASGYVAAIKGSARLLGRAGTGAASAATWLVAQALRRVAAVALRV